MNWRPPHRAAPGCVAPRCANLEEAVVRCQGVLQPDDRCLKGKPMHAGCAWHETAEQVALKAARDQAMLSAARQPMGRR